MLNKIKRLNITYNKILRPIKIKLYACIKIALKGRKIIQRPMFPINDNNFIQNRFYKSLKDPKIIRHIKIAISFT